MLDHMTFRVTDIQRTKAFYSAALAPLGYSVSFDGNFGAQPDEFLHGFRGGGDAGLAVGELLQDSDAHAGPVRR